ncbi:uncharacterized protein LOC144114889 isoform X1 [Amblyomma americanum]
MPAACSSGPSVEGVPNAPAAENIPSCSELSSTTVCARELPPSLQSCSEEGNTSEEAPCGIENSSTNSLAMQRVIIEHSRKTVLLCTSENAALTIEKSPSQMQGTISHSLLKFHKKPAMKTDIHTESSVKQARDDREETPSTGACVQNCISQPLSKKRQMDTPGSTTMPSTPICSRTFDGAGPQVESVWKEMETLKRKLAGCQK